MPALAICPARVPQRLTTTEESERYVLLVNSLHPWHDTQSTHSQADMVSPYVILRYVANCIAPSPCTDLRFT